MTGELSKLALVLAAQGRRKDWVAARLSVSQGTVTRWCSGERAIPAARVTELAALLGVHEEDIVETTPQQEKAGVA